MLMLNRLRSYVTLAPWVGCAALLLAVGLGRCGGASTETPPETPPADAPTTDACTPPDATEPVHCPADRPRCDINGLFGQPFACLACLQGSDCNGPPGTV